MQQQQEQVAEEFEFSSRQEYERALADVISAKRGKLKKRDEEALNKRYESLLDEYIRFSNTHRPNG